MSLKQLQIAAGLGHALGSILPSSSIPSFEPGPLADGPKVVNGKHVEEQKDYIGTEDF